MESLFASFIIIAIFVVLKTGFCMYILARRYNRRKTSGYIISNPTTATTSADCSFAPTGIENPNYNEDTPPYCVSVNSNQQQTGSVAPPAFDEVAAYAFPSYDQTFHTSEHVCQSDQKSLIV